MRSVPRIYPACESHSCVPWAALDDGEQVFLFRGKVVIATMGLAQLTPTQIQWMVDAFNAAETRSISELTFPE